MAHPSVTDPPLKITWQQWPMACWKVIVSMCWHDIEFTVIIMGNYTANGCFNYMYMYSVYLCLHAVHPGLSSQ